MSSVELAAAMTMGSLFDGIGGFPLGAARYGIKTIWASEIEPFPMEVTKRRFPSMVHKGDITKLSGKLLFPVDIICGGSPCQDLSVAGARAGLSGARSGLFMEQIRIIKEMRTAERERGRTGVQIRPRYMAWENVPGAFSSGSPKGEDFRIVLEEILRVYDGSATIPRPFPYYQTSELQIPFRLRQEKRLRHRAFSVCQAQIEAGRTICSLFDRPVRGRSRRGNRRLITFEENVCLP